MSKSPSATIKKKSIECHCGGGSDWVYQEPMDGYRCPDCQNVLHTTDAKVGK